MTTPFFVIHSHHTDGAWRGLVNCLAAPQGGPLLFWWRADAEAYIRNAGLNVSYYTIVEVGLRHPRTPSEAELSP